MLKTGAELVAEAKSNINEVTIADLKAILSQETILIDVREPAEFKEKSIDQAMNIPRGVLEMQITQHPKVASSEDPMAMLAENDIYLICRSGARSALAAESLNKMGFSNVFSVAGGMMAWD